jgi:phosphate transport system ATP-binding protein
MIKRRPKNAKVKKTKKPKQPSAKALKKQKAQELEKIARNLLSSGTETGTKKKNGQRETVVNIQNFDFYYNKGRRQALFDINMAIKEKTITTFIGPSGSSKSTLLRSINRMNDLIDGAMTRGSIEVFGEDIYAPGYDVTLLRTNVGMVFQKANPFPLSIYENVAYGPKSQGVKSKEILDELVRDALKKAAL